MDGAVAVSSVAASSGLPSLRMRSLTLIKLEGASWLGRGSDPTDQARPRSRPPAKNGYARTHLYLYLNLPDPTYYQGNA